ncbi:hypothetical protein [Phenylobacterium sp.]|uniref:hypothetical protein n=1 Tax=Phenylobacterium sp. TaxID=1871053 RepID=UPI0035B319B7
MKTVAFAAGVLAAALAGPAGAQERLWTLDIPKAPDDVASLTYALPASGDVALRLSCRKKTGQIRIQFQAAQGMAATRRGEVWVDEIGRQPPWPLSVTIASMDQQTTLRGQAVPDEATGGSIVSVEVATRAPVVEAWRTSAELKLTALDATADQPPAKKGLVRRFLGYCD